MLLLIRKATGSWRAGTRARALYVGMTVAFAALAVAGVATGNVAAAVLAAIAAVVTAGLAVIAPRLPVWTS